MVSDAAVPGNQHHATGSSALADGIRNKRIDDGQFSRVKAGIDWICRDKKKPVPAMPEPNL